MFKTEQFWIPILEKTTKAIRWVTGPIVMPIWFFCLMYLIGGASLWYSLIIAIMISFIAYKIWKD